MKWIQGLKTPAQEHFSCTGVFSCPNQIRKNSNYIWIVSVKKVSHCFHGPAHNPYQVDLLYRRIMNHNHQVPEETCKCRKAPRKYWIGWVDHSIRDSLWRITGNYASWGLRLTWNETVQKPLKWNWIKTITFNAFVSPSSSHPFPELVGITLLYRRYRSKHLRMQQASNKHTCRKMWKKGNEMHDLLMIHHCCLSTILHRS